MLSWSRLHWKPPILPRHWLGRLLLACVIAGLAPAAWAEDCYDKFAAAGAFPGSKNCLLYASTVTSGLGGLCSATLATEYCAGAPPGGGKPYRPDDTPLSLDAPDNVEYIVGDVSMDDVSGGCGDADAGQCAEASGGDPVNLFTGQFDYAVVDHTVADLVPLQMGRVYRSSLRNADGQAVLGAFGLGMQPHYDLYLRETEGGARLQLVLPSGVAIPFARVADGRWRNGRSRGNLYGTEIAQNGARERVLTLHDRHRWTFSLIGQRWYLSEVADRNGNRLTLTREQTGLLIAVQGPSGRRLQIGYSGSDDVRARRLISRITDPLGRTTTYAYDARLRLVKATARDGGTTTYEWDGQDRLVGITDALGIKALVNEYDGAQRVVRQTLADGSTFRFAYTPSSGTVTRTEVTDRRGAVRQVDFDANGNVVANQQAANGNILERNEHRFTYDAASGKLVRSEDYRGRVTLYAYDANGNLARRTQVAAFSYGDRVTEATYDPVWNVPTRLKLPNGGEWTYQYDGRGNLVRVRAPDGGEWTQAYDSQGRRTRAANPLGHATTYGYSGADLASVTDPLGRTVRYATDAAGRRTRVTDPLGHATQVRYDAMDRVLEIVNARNGKIAFAYDAAGRLTARTDERGNTTRFTHTPIGRVATRTEADGARTTYGYDLAGALSETVDPRGKRMTIKRDKRGQPETIEYGAATADNWPWKSQLDIIDLGNGFNLGDTNVGLKLLRYDNAGRLVYEWMSGITRVYRTYEASTPGQLTTMRMKGSSVIPDSPTLRYAYDPVGRVTRISQDGRATALQFEWDRAGRLVRSTATGQGGRARLVTDYSYDAAGQLTGLDYRSAGGKLGEIRYSYDAAGRRTGIGGSLNPIELPGASVTDAQYDARNRLTRWAGRTLRYDANGNLIDDGVRTYTWNERDQLRRVTTAATGLVQFGYDPAGRRTIRNQGDEWLDYIHDGANLAQEFDRHSKITTLHGPAVDMPQIRQDSDGTERFLLQDGNGNVIGLSDGLGTTLETQYRYEPYGKTRVLGQASRNTQQYTGRENDATGLYYYRARYYDPETGRFVSPDPIGWAAGQTNGYAYVGGDPLNLVDPGGDVPIYRGDNVTMHAYPGPQAGGTEHARWGPGQSYHVHMVDNQGREARMSTETWKPLTEKDAAVFNQSKQMQRACNSLTDGEKKFLDRVNRQIFHRGVPTANQLLRMGGWRGRGSSGRSDN
ncbi:RHS repeat-associated core domain-containing protein [Cupriavidus malaysiensis]|uniref:RHS repeat protein n=1 Tax=Cupriavidus malaysiensis TaxID=367825 RepID=A0ABM6FAH4_9BURK|nr:RHS repeat-associated core domain-containing protein [Cupriavidus malaysiensis]AOZ08727.1 hypothetical protein BKK80_22695 [Cupriavidus malaysiensis]